MMTWKHAAALAAGFTAAILVAAIGRKRVMPERWLDRAPDLQVSDAWRRAHAYELGKEGDTP
jgi:hypothetical protein